MTNSIDIVFLIPLVSKKLRNNWIECCNHLDQTLQSIRNSIINNYRVVVVGNEDPSLPIFKDTRFTFISVNDKMLNNGDKNFRGRFDKLMKIEKAWIFAKQKYNPKYIMKLDADDLISNKLTELLIHSDNAAGFIIKKGYIWNQSKYFIQISDSFDRICGSCLILRSDLADMSGPFDNFALSGDKSHFDDGSSLIPGAGICTLLLHDFHQRYDAQFSYLGYDLKEVDFNAVIYRIVNNDSLSKSDLTNSNKMTLRWYLGKLRRQRLLTKKIKTEFSIAA